MTSFIIIDEEIPDIELYSISNPEFCRISQSVKEVDGYGNIVLVNEPNINYVWSNGTTGSFINGLGPGTYSVTATGQLGCEKTESFTLQCCEAYIEYPEEEEQGSDVQIDVEDFYITPTFIYPDEGASDGSIFLNLGGGSGNYVITWYSSNNIISNQEDLVNVPSGVYTVFIQDGCSSQTFRIELFNCNEDDFMDLIKFDIKRHPCYQGAKNITPGIVCIDFTAFFIATFKKRIVFRSIEFTPEYPKHCFDDVLDDYFCYTTLLNCSDVNTIIGICAELENQADATTEITYDSENFTCTSMLSCDGGTPLEVEELANVEFYGVFDPEYDPDFPCRGRAQCPLDGSYFDKPIEGDLVCDEILVQTGDSECTVKCHCEFNGVKINDYAVVMTNYDCGEVVYNADGTNGSDGNSKGCNDPQKPIPDKAVIYDAFLHDQDEFCADSYLDITYQVPNSETATEDDICTVCIRCDADNENYMIKGVAVGSDTYFNHKGQCVTRYFCSFGGYIFGNDNILPFKFEIEGNCLTGEQDTFVERRISDLEINQFVAFPNPFNNELFLLGSSNKDKNFDIRIYDINGSIITRMANLKFNSENAISTANWPPGLYQVVFISNNDEISYEKVLKL